MLSAGSAEECLVLASITFQCGKDVDVPLCTNAAFYLDLCRVKDKKKCLFLHRAPPEPGFSPPADRLLLLEDAEGGPLRPCRTVPEGCPRQLSHPCPRGPTRGPAALSSSAEDAVPSTRLQGLAFCKCMRCHAQLPSAGLGSITTDLNKSGPSLD